MQQSVVKLWLCKERCLQKRWGKGWWQGISHDERLLLCRQDCSIAWKLAMVPESSGETAETVTAAECLQGFLRDPHCSWVLAMDTACETGTVRGCCGMPCSCGCRRALLHLCLPTLDNSPCIAGQAAARTGSSACHSAASVQQQALTLPHGAFN